MIARTPELVPTPPRPGPHVDRWGTPETTWRPSLADLPAWPFPSAPGRIVVIAPHPDDETLGVGGLLAMLVAAGWDALVLAVTDGEAAYGPEPGGRGELARIRRQEQAAALGVLGSGRILVRRLGLADGAVSDGLGPLVDAVRRDLADADLCVAPLAWDGHPDHEACGKAATLAAVDVPIVQYPIWAWHWATPAEVPLDRFARIPLSAAALQRKHVAMACFVSQRTPPPGRPVVLPPHVMTRFARAFEVIVT